MEQVTGRSGDDEYSCCCYWWCVVVDEDKEEEQDAHDAIERMVEVEENRGRKQRKLCVNAKAVWVTFFVAKSLVISVWMSLVIPLVIPLVISLVIPLVISLVIVFLSVWCCRR